jgi:phage host-nuclease inhibitor protein Gam
MAMNLKVRTPKDVDSALLRAGQLERQITEIQSRYTEQIEALRAACERQVSPLLEEHAEVVGKVEKFALRHPWHKGDPVKIEFNFGFIKWSIPVGRLAFPKGEKEAIAKVKAAGKTELIRTKEEIVKDAAKRLPEPELRKLGMVIETGEPVPVVGVDYEAVIAYVNSDRRTA